MENCGLTDIGANHILDCLKVNRTIVDFYIGRNPEISGTLKQTIDNQLGKKQEKENPPSKEDIIKKLHEKLRLLEEQLVSEKKLRNQVDLLNEQLHQRVIEIEYDQNEKKREFTIPKGYTLVKQESWDKLINEKNKLEEAAITLRSRPKHLKLKKARSEPSTKIVKSKSKKYSKSEHGMLKKSSNNVLNKRIYVETGIGDNKSTARTYQTEYQSKISKANQDDQPATKHYISREDIMVNAFKIFMKKKYFDNVATDEVSSAQIQEINTDRSVDRNLSLP